MSVCLDLPARLQIPYTDNPIVTAASQLSPVRTSPQRLDSSLVSFELPHALAGAYVPPAQHTNAIAAN
jgi:hypothetical protein